MCQSGGKTGQGESGAGRRGGGEHGPKSKRDRPPLSFRKISEDWVEDKKRSPELANPGRSTHPPVQAFHPRAQGKQQEGSGLGHPSPYPAGGVVLSTGPTSQLGGGGWEASKVTPGAEGLSSCGPVGGEAEKGSREEGCSEVVPRSCSSPKPVLPVPLAACSPEASGPLPDKPSQAAAGESERAWRGP